MTKKLLKIVVALIPMLFLFSTLGSQGISHVYPKYGGSGSSVLRGESTGGLAALQAAFCWNTFLGGLNPDYGNGVAVDGNGNVYVTGQSSPNWGSPIDSYGGAFVAKLDPNGNLLWNTFLGGVGDGIAVDGNGSVYVTGYCSSSWGLPKRPMPSCAMAAFVAKLNNQGTLIWNTFLGGSGQTYGFDVAVGGGGHVYVAGNSTDPWGAPLRPYTPGARDAFAAKIDTNGNLIWNTFLGSAQDDYGWGVAADQSGNAYVTGYSYYTWGSPKRAFTNWTIDAFAAKLDTNGSLAWNTFLGDWSSEMGEGIAVDGSGNVFVTGYSRATWGSPLRAHGLDVDMFVAKIDGSGALIWNTFSGGSGEDSGKAIAVDGSGNVFVTGYSDAPWSPQIGDFFGGREAFAAKLDTNGAFSWSMFLGQGDEYGLGIAVDGAGNVLLAGKSTWTWGSPIRDYTWDWDAFVAKISSDSANVPIIGLSKTSFRFGSVQSGTPTQAQTSVITNAGTGTLTWSATPSTDWISVSPGNGTGSGVLTIGISRTDMAPGSYTGTISVTAPGASNSPQTINVGLDIRPSGFSSAPFGAFDTPLNNSTVSSSIAVTGWALDDVETTGVKIYRNPMSGEPTQPNGLVFIGDGVFVEGSRPDVEAQYPHYPLNTRAGWGYMLLTNFLPNGGNGTFTLHAYARDKEGHEVRVGSKTITCDNLHAVKPFGAIDTPGQGAEISGSPYFNFGWALTPLPNMIPTDGSTMWVWVDSLPLAHPSYNHYRGDIASLFPGYLNSNAAVGVYELDTTAFANGVHTIAWSVRDNAGNEDGIGSRYFSILNAGTPSPQGKPSDAANQAGSSGRSFSKAGELGELRDLSMNPIHMRKGFDRSLAPEPVLPALSRINSHPGQGPLLIIRELERVEILLDDKAFSADAERRMSERAGLARNGGFPSFHGSAAGSSGARWEGYLVVGEELRRLPIGSTLDAVTGVFSWLPGPGFLGEYRLAFVDLRNKSRACATIRIEPLARESGR